MLMSSPFALGAPLVPQRDCDHHPAVGGRPDGEPSATLWGRALTLADQFQLRQLAAKMRGWETRTLR